MANTPVSMKQAPAMSGTGWLTGLSALPKTARSAPKQIEVKAAA